MSHKTITIFGVGAFGYAVLKHLEGQANLPHNLIAFDADQNINDSLQKERKHPHFHKDISISDSTHVAESAHKAIFQSDILILVASSDASREVARAIKLSAKDGVTILNLAKGLETETGKRLSEIYNEKLAEKDYSYAVMAGGTTAEDLINKRPIGADLASTDEQTAELLKTILGSDTLSINLSSDLKGVELASALKNIISMVAGMVQGFGLPHGTLTFAISKFSQQIAAECISGLGAHSETFSLGSQCWGNDIWLSSLSDTRNRRFGELIGQGTPVKQAIQSMGESNSLIEGVNTLKALIYIPALYEIYIIRLLHKLIVEESIDINSFKKEFLASLN
jgi:glycerol-3-phosphate dehydrogenase (NAD(P)+)